MGSKNFNAVIFNGTQKSKVFDPEALTTLGREGYAEIKNKDAFDIWTRQGTMMVIDWANSIGGLPSYNFSQGVFKFASGINGDAAETIKVDRQGCAKCNCRCGIVVRDADGGDAELDYENIALLGSNIGIKDIKEASALNRIADEMGLDTISLGNCIGFLMEASQNGLIKEKLAWGDFEGCKALIGHGIMVNSVYCGPPTDEIAAAGFEPGDDVALVATAERLRHHESIIEYLSQAAGALAEEGAGEALGIAVGALRRAARLDDGLDELARQAEELAVIAGELSVADAHAELQRREDDLGFARVDLERRRRCGR